MMALRRTAFVSALLFIACGDPSGSNGDATGVGSDATTDPDATTNPDATSDSTGEVTGPEHPGEDLTLAPVGGTVTLRIPWTAARVINAFDEATVTDGAFILDAPEGDRQLAIALTAAGHPVALAWLGPGHTVIDHQTTAEVMAFIALGGFHAPRALHARLIELLDGAPELAELADSLSRSYFNYETGFSGEDEEQDYGYQAQLEDACRALFKRTSAGAPRIPRSMLINPADEQSGLRIDNLGSLEEATLTNRFRRRALAFVDRVGIIRDGVEEKVEEEVGRVRIDPVEGLRDGVGTLNQIIIGANEPGQLSRSEALAYTPKSFGPVSLPNVDGADRTRYRVAVVGPGDAVGALATLPQKARDQQPEVALEFMVRDYLIPFITDIVAPAKLVLSSDPESRLAATITDLLRDNADLMESAIAGRAAHFMQLVLGIGAVQGKVPIAVLNQVTGAIAGQIYGGGTAATAVAQSAVMEQLRKVIFVFGAVNVTLKLADANLIEQDMGLSNRGDVWDILVSDANVRLDPVAATIPPGDFVTLTANVVGAGEDDVFEYRFTTAGAHGILQSALARGTDVTSSAPFVTYDATSVGEETVKVTVFLVDGAAREELGSAEATITVAGTGVRLAPSEEAEVQAFGEQVFSATLFGDELPASVIFRWSTDGLYGNFGGQTAVEATVSDASHEVTFVAGFEPGVGEVVVEVFEPGADEPLARTRANVRVRPLRVAITPVTVALEANDQIELTATVTPTPPAGAFEYAWSVAGYQGQLDGATTVEHAGTSASDSVTYQAAAAPFGCGQVVTVRVTYELAGKSVELLPGRARMRVDCPAEAVIRSARDRVDAGDSLGLFCDVASEGELGALTYAWSVEAYGGGGRIEYAGSELGATPTPYDSVRFVAGPDRGDVEVTCTVYEDGVVVAEATTWILIVEEPEPPCQEAFDYAFWNTQNGAISMAVSGTLGGRVEIDIFIPTWDQDYYDVDVYVARGTANALVTADRMVGDGVGARDMQTVYTDVMVDHGGLKVRISGAVVNFTARGSGHVSIDTLPLSPPCEEGPGSVPCCPYITYDTPLDQMVLTGPLVIAYVTTYAGAERRGGLAVGVIQSK